MRFRLDEDKPAKKNAPEKMIEKMTESYSTFRRLTSINPDDSIPVALTKIFFGFIGMMILVALSPFLLFSIIMAFLLAS